MPPLALMVVKCGEGGAAECYHRLDNARERVPLGPYFFSGAGGASLL